MPDGTSIWNGPEEFSTRCNLTVTLHACLKSKEKGEGRTTLLFTLDRGLLMNFNVGLLKYGTQRVVRPDLLIRPN